MNIVEEIVAKGFIPILSYQNDIYRMVVEEGSKAATGILKESVDVFLVHSIRVNAYAFRANDHNVILMTDALIVHLAKNLAQLLNDDNSIEFIKRSIKYDYESNNSPPDVSAEG
jgi:hypothetical protein